jgi:hypothetical protein
MVIGKKSGNSLSFMIFFLQDFMRKAHIQKFGPFSTKFLANLQNFRPRIFTAAGIFLGPLLRFAAEILAGWQHWL